MRHAQPPTRPAPHGTRVVHCKRERYDVYIGRGRDPKTGVRGPWGNPFSHQAGTLAKFRVGSRKEAIERYEQYLLEAPELLARLPELKGKTLGCWCAPKPCHGDVLARLADALR
jgi:hypothetical protein